jgi:hypothetical protein
MAGTADYFSTIPLDDSRWWSLDETLKYCRSRPLFRPEDLAAAVNQEQVHSKLEYLDRSSLPAKRIALLLTSEFFQHEAAITDRLALMPRTKKAAQMRPYELSFWANDIKKFWPDRVVSEASDEPEGPLTPKEMATLPKKTLVPRAMKIWPREKNEINADWGRRLLKHLGRTKEQIKQQLKTVQNLLPPEPPSD